MSFCTVCLPDGADLFRDVDTHRTPRDAAAAADAARCFKLIDPGSQFMGHPLAIARVRREPNSTSVDVGMRSRETGIPPPPPLGMIPSQIRNLFDSAAEAGGTDHRAVCAGQTPAGD